MTEQRIGGIEKDVANWDKYKKVVRNYERLGVDGRGHIKEEIMNEQELSKGFLFQVTVRK